MKRNINYEYIVKLNLQCNDVLILSCENVYSNLKLEERTWECESCGKAHDRDINAAINVLKFGMEQAEFKCLENENSIGSPCL